MVEIFKTDVLNRSQANTVLKIIFKHFPTYINFDLTDADKILRIQSSNIEIDRIVQLLAIQGFSCIPLV